MNLICQDYKFRCDLIVFSIADGSYVSKTTNINKCDVQPNTVAIYRMCESFFVHVLVIILTFHNVTIDTLIVNMNFFLVFFLLESKRETKDLSKTYRRNKTESKKQSRLCKSCSCYKGVKSLKSIPFFLSSLSNHKNQNE